MDRELEQQILKLWGECVSPKIIAAKFGLDVDEVLDVVECELNYEEVDHDK